MEGIADVSQICRVCLNQAELMHAIFEVKISEVHNVHIIDFIRRLTSVKILRSDELPHNICIHCINNLCKAFDFAQMCIDNDLKLKAQLNKNKIQVKENVSCVTERNDEDLSLNETENEMINEKADNQNELVIIRPTECNKIEYDEDILKSENEIEELLHVDILRNEAIQWFKDDDPAVDNDYKCDICDRSFQKEKQLRAHNRIHNKTRGEYVCNICGQSFGYLHLLNKHNYKHQNDKPFPCSFCDKGCVTAESLRRHMKIHDKSYVKKMHGCNVCAKEFPYPSFLAEHMKNHTGERPYLCSLCGKGFRQSGTLRYHMRSHTGNRPFICNICHSSFISRGVLKVHMRRHTNERPYVCDICGMAFRQSTDMKSHRRIHTGDKPALCTICGKRFSSSSQLNIHVRSHTGEKPFVCSTCSKSFTTKALLVKHERIHTGEKPYVCKICSKAFNQSSTLKTHLNTHIQRITPANQTVKQDDSGCSKVNVIVHSASSVPLLPSTI